MGDAGTLTEAGTVLGTAAYISPEQAAGLPATAASDVYSFGVILFRMLTGRLPFMAANAMELVRMNRDDPPPRVEDVRAGAPAVLAFTADASLAKDPSLRPADGSVLLATLRDQTSATMIAPVAAADATQVLRPAPRRRRSPYLVPLIVLALVLLLGGAALALALTGNGGGADNGTSAPPASLSLPNVTTAKTATAAPTTTAPTTTAPTTTSHTTSAHTTTAHTTTHHVTTTPPPTTTHHVTTTPPPTTTAPPPPPTTTLDTTTVATTTDTTSTDTTTVASAQITTTTGP
jgi:eukaryotic-like serine/threonine-protein kinase